MHYGGILFYFYIRIAADIGAMYMGVRGLRHTLKYYYGVLGTH